MKRICSLSILLLTTLVATAQQADVDSVIMQAREKCQSIHSGHYVMERRMKYMDSKEATLTRQTCDFMKMPDDTVCGMLFAFSDTSISEDGEWVDNNLYTGHEYVSYYDSTGTMWAGNKWPDEIASYYKQFNFYSPLMRKNCYPVATDGQISDSSYRFSLSDAQLDGMPCHHVNFYKGRDDKPTMGLLCIRYEVNLWIDKESGLPVKYTEAFTNVQQQDTLYQYEECRLLEFRPYVDESRLTLKSIPDKVKLEGYEPYRPPEPLPDGTSAPDWALTTLTCDTVRLADLRGKVVLLDFFYKTCAPCCAALPALQSIYEKYKDKGFVMIGIDPFDDPVKADMADFLAKRGITYTVLFADRKMSEDYRVYAYPTLFILNRNGNIVETHKGFRKDLEEVLDAALQKVLDTK